MREFKGTKGKWIADKSEVYRPASSGSISPYWKQICSFVNNGTDECKANAKLIAAAPELLKELQRIKLDIDLGTISVKKDSPIYKGIDSAIQKALGNENQ